MASECSVCYINYDQNERRPRVLPCGHTFCCVCIITMINANDDNDNLLCPDCRTSHAATTIEHFPINYVLEVSIKETRESIKETRASKRETQKLKLKYETTSASEDQKEKTLSTNELKVKKDDIMKKSRGISKKMRGLLNEQKTSVINMISCCSEKQREIDQYIKQLADWKQDHLKLEESLENMVKLNRDALIMIEKEEANVTGIKQEGADTLKLLECSLENMQNINTAKDAVMVIDDADQNILEVEDWQQKCQELFPDANTVTNSWKVRDAIKSAIDTAKQVSKETYTTKTPDPSYTIIDKAKILRGLPRKLEVKDLFRMTQNIRKLINHNEVIGVDENQGHIYTSKMSIDKDKLYMHCLQEQQHPPNYTYTIEVNDVLHEMYISTTMVFMDLGYDDSTIGRVHIRLSGNLPLTRQFCLLCIGQRGKSYKESTLHMLNKGQPGECVYGGDYEGKLRRGGASIVGLNIIQNKNQYKHSGKAGAVRGLWPDSFTKSAQFGIITRNCNENLGFGYVFGEVVSGLDLLQATVNYSNIQDVIVKDCGIVLDQ